MLPPPLVEDENYKKKLICFCFLLEIFKTNILQSDKYFINIKKMSKSQSDKQTNFNTRKNHV